jgi:hypothetical protein
VFALIAAFASSSGDNSQGKPEKIEGSSAAFFKTTFRSGNEDRAVHQPNEGDFLEDFSPFGDLPGVPGKSGIRESSMFGEFVDQSFPCISNVS